MFRPFRGESEASTNLGVWCSPFKVTPSIEALEAQLVARRARLTKLEEEAANEARAAQDEQADDLEADDLEAQGQALLKRAAEIKAKKKKK